MHRLYIFLPRTLLSVLTSTLPSRHVCPAIYVHARPLSLPPPLPPPPPSLLFALFWGYNRGDTNLIQLYSGINIKHTPHHIHHLCPPSLPSSSSSKFHRLLDGLQDLVRIWNIVLREKAGGKEGGREGGRERGGGG